MAHMAEDIVSYEHDTPLEYLGKKMFVKSVTMG